MGGWSLRRIAAANKSSEPLSEPVSAAYDLEVHLVLVREKDGQQPGGHGVVEDRVDGGVDVEHETREVQEVVEQLRRKASMDKGHMYERR